jgi:microcystin-dependent protein
VGEIRMFGGNFAPNGWSFCDGSVLSIADNEVLFNLIGTTYGGDGQSTFQLPDLRSRVPIHQGTGPGLSQVNLAQTGGTEAVTLTTSQIPNHTHTPLCNNAAGTQSGPGNGIWAINSTLGPYSTVAPSVAMDAAAIGQTGGNQPHDNMLPYLCINFIISLFGVFPSQT